MNSPYDFIDDINDKKKEILEKIDNQKINTCPLCMLDSKMLDYFIFFHVTDSNKLNKFLKTLGIDE